MTTKPTYTSAIRFPDFLNDGEWEVKRLEEISDYENGIAHENDIDSDGDFIIVNSKFISSDGQIKKRTNVPHCLAQKDDVLMVLSDLPNGRALAKCFYVAENNLYTVNQRICKFHPKNVNSKLLYYLVNRNEYFLSFDDGVKQTNLKKEDVLNCPLIIPKSIEEQDFIATCLTSLDELLSATNEKLEQLKAYKKGLMQNLFPAKGKKLPELRFKEFEKDGEWEVKKYEDCLDYEQPQSYLVSSENYKKTGIPVLTAGKTFVLGFTDETFGVYTKLPVIIFDDFTTDCRYVDFPFKAKSSAMKMLSAKEGYDLRFVFATMQNNEFKPHDHQRHWISIYSKFKVEIPSLAEQHKIAGCLASIDDMINQYINKVELLELYKKGLMQQMFPTSKR